MGPNYDRLSGGDVQPVLNEAGLFDNGVETSTQRPNATPESLSAGELRTTPMPPTDPVSTISSTPTPIQLNKQLSSLPAAAPTDDNPTIADDNDLIEKEWVNKAKKIVAETKHDPYVQTKEMSLFKADYLKKRYNKVLKVAEG